MLDTQTRSPRAPRQADPDRLDRQMQADLAFLRARGFQFTSVTAIDLRKDIVLAALVLIKRELEAKGPQP